MKFQPDMYIVISKQLLISNLSFFLLGVIYEPKMIILGNCKMQKYRWGKLKTKSGNALVADMLTKKNLRSRSILMLRAFIEPKMIKGFVDAQKLLSWSTFLLIRCLTLKKIMVDYMTTESNK